MGASEEAVVRRACELWSSRDAAAMIELFAKDSVYDNVPAQEPFHGREALREWLEEVFEHLWVEIELLHIVSDGEWVLSERLDTHVVGGRRLPLPVMNTSRVVNGEILLWRDYYDQKTVADLGIA
jgi:limonene-1,2-epoxide hydrolase